VTRARNGFRAAKQQIKNAQYDPAKLKVRAMLCAITLSLCINSSARKNGVPVAAAIDHCDHDGSTIEIFAFRLTLERIQKNDRRRQDAMNRKTNVRVSGPSSPLVCVPSASALTDGDNPTAGHIRVQ
jgi:hypothetical protein